MACHIGGNHHPTVKHWGTRSSPSYKRWTYSPHSRVKVNPIYTCHKCTYRTLACREGHACIVAINRKWTDCNVYARIIFTTRNTRRGAMHSTNKGQVVSRQTALIFFAAIMIHTSTKLMKCFASSVMDRAINEIVVGQVGTKGEQQMFLMWNATFSTCVKWNTNIDVAVI